MTRSERTEQLLARYSQQDVDRYRDYSYDDMITMYSNAVVALHRAMMLASPDDPDVGRLRDHAHMLQYVVHIRTRNGER